MNEKQLFRAIGDLPQDLLADAALPKRRVIRDSFISMTAGYKWMWAAAVALCIGLNIYAIRGVAQSLQAGWEHGEPSVTSAGNAPMTTSAYAGKEGPKISFAGMQFEEAERLAATEGIAVAAEHAASLEPKGTVIAERSNFDGSYWLTVSDGAISVKQVNTIVSLEFACAEDPGIDSSTGLMLTDDAHNYIFGVTRCTAEDGSNPHVGFNYEMLRYISGRLRLYRLQYAGRDNIPSVTGCIGTISLDQSEGNLRAEADSVLNWQVQEESGYRVGIISESSDYENRNLSFLLTHSAPEQYPVSIYINDKPQPAEFSQSTEDSPVRYTVRMPEEYRFDDRIWLTCRDEVVCLLNPMLVMSYNSVPQYYLLDADGIPTALSHLAELPQPDAPAESAAPAETAVTAPASGGKERTALTGLTVTQAEAQAKALGYTALEFIPTASYRAKDTVLETEEYPDGSLHLTYSAGPVRVCPNGLIQAALAENGIPTGLYLDNGDVTAAPIAIELQDPATGETLGKGAVEKEHCGVHSIGGVKEQYCYISVPEAVRKDLSGTMRLMLNIYAPKIALSAAPDGTYDRKTVSESTTPRKSALIGSITFSQAGGSLTAEAKDDFSFARAVQNIGGFAQIDPGPSGTNLWIMMPFSITAYDPGWQTLTVTVNDVELDMHPLFQNKIMLDLNLIRQDNLKSEIVISLRGEELVKLYLWHDPNDGSYYLIDENHSNPAGIFDFRVSVPPLE